MAITPQQARAELARRELEKRASIQQSVQGQPSKKFDVVDILNRLARGAYYNVPFGRRVGQIASSVGLADPEKIYGAMGQGQTFPERLAENVGAVAPDLLMASPFMRGAGAIPKIPQIIKSALGFGAYGGTKAALQGQPIIPSALSNAKQAALYHVAGRLGATVIPKFIPGAKRIGSALGGGVAGGLTGGEEGMAMGAGFGALYPSEPLKTQKIAKSVVNYALRPSKSTKKWGADPVSGIVKEGILGKNWQETGEKVQIRLNELESLKDKVKIDARNRDVRISYAKNKVFEPIQDLLVKLNKDPKFHAQEIKVLKNTVESLTKDIDISNMNIDQAYDLRNRLNMMKPSGIFSKTSQTFISDALHEVYHNMVQAINNSGVSPELKIINKRQQNLIAAEKAILDAKNRNSNAWNLIPMGMFGYGLWTGNPIIAGIVGTRAALKTPFVSTTIGRLLGERYPRIPKTQEGKE